MVKKNNEFFRKQRNLSRKIMFDKFRGFSPEKNSLDDFEILNSVNEIKNILLIMKQTSDKEVWAFELVKLSGFINNLNLYNFDILTEIIMEVYSTGHLNIFTQLLQEFYQDKKIVSDLLMILPFFIQFLFEDKNKCEKSLFYLNFLEDVLAVNNSDEDFQNVYSKVAFMFVCDS